MGFIPSRTRGGMRLRACRLILLSLFLFLLAVPHGLAEEACGPPNERLTPKESLHRLSDALIDFLFSLSPGRGEEKSCFRALFRALDQFWEDLTAFLQKWADAPNSSPLVFLPPRPRIPGAPAAGHASIRRLTSWSF